MKISGCWRWRKGGGYIGKGGGVRFMYETIKRDAVFKVENKILDVIIIFFQQISLWM